MGGATRFVTLLAAPLPPLRPSVIRLHRRLFSLSATPLRLLTVSSPSKTKIRTPQLVKCFHSQSSNNTYTLHSAAAQQQPHHPWPEWTHFLDILSNGQGFSVPEDYQIPPEDAFVVYEKLPDDFVRSAAACIAFARARPDLLGLLSGRDIDAVVSNGTPFLFKSALDTARRMRAFLGTDGNNVSEFDKANTVDLMKYILSYASNPTVSSERNGLYSRELVDSSVRNLLHELATVGSGVPAGYVPSSVPQFPHRGGQIPKPFGQNIEMKRGDWICPKCNFMNFARNIKCLECEEARPKRQLTGGEWECPECNFFNYGRNVVCLRCDCRRPGAPLFNNSNSQSSSLYNEDYSYKNRLVRNEEKAQQWFSKISQMSNATDVNRAASDKYSSEIMPLRKGENQFVVNTQKTPLERKVADAHHENHLSNNGNRTDSTFDTSINPSMDGILDSGPSAISERADSGITPRQNVRTKFSHPADALSNGDQTLEIDYGTKVSIEGHKSQSFNEKEQDEKSEKWFKRMAELHDVKDLPSAISDEDLPEIMPMRKGENRFVVSKRKDRSLTSPKYKRQVAMDEVNNTNFVPFVPFPPGYFARKDTEQPSGQDSSVKAVSETSSSKNTTETEKSDDLNKEMAGTNDIPRIHNQPGSSALQSSPAESTSQSSITPRTMNSNISFDGYSGTGTATGAPSSQLTEDENVQIGWTGKSLEGSAVKEPDPLDMSEEAKAERWFKRVAQIKDISELSQIPDEDFPSIMPMRKGVNRFVISKRKTPLERRLTSQQHKRNLPIVSNDSVKKNESDNS